MRLTIIPADGTVYVDGAAVAGLTFTSPADVHALQWSGTGGWVERVGGAENEVLQGLPSWALDAVAVREAALEAIDLAAAALAHAAANPTPEEIQAAVIAATQARLDAFAKTRNYDGILSASTYATSTMPKFAAEGQYAVTARDQTWSALYALMGEVQAGAVPIPESFADVEPLLPALEWPA